MATVCSSPAWGCMSPNDGVSLRLDSSIVLIRAGQLTLTLRVSLFEGSNISWCFMCLVLSSKPLPVCVVYVSHSTLLELFQKEHDGRRAPYQLDPHVRNAVRFPCLPPLGNVYFRDSLYIMRGSNSLDGSRGDH